MNVAAAPDYLKSFKEDPSASTQSFPTAIEMVLHWSECRGTEAWLHQPVNGVIRTWTWAEAVDESRKVAAFLLSKGVRPGDHGAICSVNSAHWFMADTALQMAGVTVTPIFTTMDQNNISHVMQLSEAKVIFVGPAENTGVLDEQIDEGVLVIGLPGNTSRRCHYQWNDVVSQTSPLAEINIPDAESIYSLVFTSGSTGVPKGVMISHRAYRSIGVNLVRGLQATSDEVLLSFLPLAHMAERAIIMAQTYYTGCQVYFNEGLETFAKDIVRAKPTVFFAVPRLWEKFAYGVAEKFGSQESVIAAITDPHNGGAIAEQIRNALGFGRTRILITGSAPTAPVLHRFFEAIGLPLYDMFGQSEILTGSANMPGARKIGTIGRPFLNTDIKLDPDTSELLMRSESAMSGYYKQPEETHRTLVDGWVRTGDKAVIDEDGYLSLIGRVKEIFKTSKGKYVAPAPIEARLAESPLLEQLCLIGSGRVSTMMLATLSPKGMTTDEPELVKNLESLLQIVNAKLEHHEKIGHMIVSRNPWTIQNGLLTHTMKIKRDKIESHFEPTIESALQMDGSRILITDR
ncbi:AMP-binding protein [Alcanivorax sp. 1008]|uniref:AMP-binding protein n=1 Tax=Alcanivorax sp. 1008 TaxID=2816853 RepID=UPI001D33A56C|nr:AMP-binding protein [Alcanivorax sp. 1008]MCC1498228.1 AMP-binding protein [Alcanivorax sp. 1008]